MNDQELNVLIDHADAIASRFCKPLESLPGILRGIRDGRDAWNRLNEQRVQLVKDIDDYQRQLKEEVEAGSVKLEAVRHNASAMEQVLETQLRTAQDETAAKIKALHAGAKAAQHDADKIIQACTDARVIAEQELAALQTQIVNAKNEYATFLKKIGGPV